MNIWQVISREIRFRKTNFLLAALAVTIASASTVGVVFLVHCHDVSTKRLLDERRADVAREGDLLQDDMRKISKGLGYNILILPADQNLSDVYAEGYAEKTMPEDYVAKLAALKTIQTIEHLLPALERKAVWPETKRTVIVTGIRGEVPFIGRKAKGPILTPVPDGSIVLGFELHQQLQIKKGDRVTFMGKPYRVCETYPQRGSKDDITLWIPLKDAQNLLGKPGEINAIWALNCNCYSHDMLAEVRAEMAAALPDTQVILLADKAVARAQARKRAADSAAAALDEAAQSAAAWRRQAERYGSILVPVVVLGSGVWIGLLALANARERRNEIGIFSAIGVNARTIVAIFLGRAILIGLLGGVLGSALAIAAVNTWLVLYGMGSVVPLTESFSLSSFGLVCLAVLGAAGLCALATWLPAQSAARVDAAVVLRKE